MLGSLKHNIFQSLINTLFSCICAYIIFVTIGHLSFEEELNIYRYEENTTDGCNNITVLNKAEDNFYGLLPSYTDTNLIFVVYPVSITRLKHPIFTAIIFFLCLIILAVGSQMALAMAIADSLSESFKFLRHNHAQFLIYLILGIFICAYPMLTAASKHWTAFAVEHQHLPLVIIGFSELLAILIFYQGGINKLISDIERMLKQRLRFILLWRLTFKFITPSLLFFLIIYKLINKSLCDCYRENDFGVEMLSQVIMILELSPIVYFMYKNWGKKMDEGFYDHSRRQIQNEMEMQ